MKVKKILRILFALIITVIIICNSGYVLTMTPNSKPMYLLVPGAVIMFIIWLITNKSIKVNYYFLSFIGLIVFSLVTFIANWEFDSINLYIGTISIIIFSFCLTWLVKFNDFISSYIKFMKFITIISLFFYTLINYFGVSFNFPVIMTSNASYYNGYIFFELVTSLSRNIGVFWEPGLFASFLIIAIIFEMNFKNKKVNSANIVIFLLGLVSTQSTVGYLIIPFIFILFISENMRRSREIILTTFLIVLCCLIYIFSYEIISFLVNFNPLMFGKLAYESDSLTTRLYGPLLNLKIFLSQPIWGVGFGNATKIFIEKSYLNNVGAQTSTFTFIIASMGLPGLIYSFNWIYGIFALKDKNMLTKLVIFIVFAIILNKEPHNGLVVTWCIMFYFLKEAAYLGCRHRNSLARQPKKLPKLLTTLSVARGKVSIKRI